MASRVPPSPLGTAAHEHRTHALWKLLGVAHRIGLEDLGAVAPPSRGSARTSSTGALASKMKTVIGG